MYEGSPNQSILVLIKRISPLVWGIVFLGLAGLLVLIPFKVFHLIAILPLIVGGLFLYQAIWKNKY